MPIMHISVSPFPRPSPTANPHFFSLFLVSSLLSLHKSCPHLWTLACVVGRPPRKESLPTGAIFFFSFFFFFIGVSFSFFPSFFFRGVFLGFVGSVLSPPPLVCPIFVKRPLLVTTPLRVTPLFMGSRRLSRFFSLPCFFSGFRSLFMCVETQFLTRTANSCDALFVSPLVPCSGPIYCQHVP